MTTLRSYRKRYFAIAALALFSTAARLSVDADSQKEELKKVTEKDKNGNTTTYTLGFEVKEKDKSGNITQWYQSFMDSDGKEIIYIARVVPNLGDHPPYESIQLITTFVYNKDRNVSESFEFFGNGTLRHHIIYKYDAKGNWIKGEIHDASGKSIGTELTPPEAHLYGKPKDR